MNRSSFRAATMLAVVVLSGRVLDRTTGQGLPHVTVSASNGATATTDASGRFKLRGAKTGETQITVKSDDVPTQHFTIKLGVGSTERDFRACSTTLDYSCGTSPLHDSNGGGSAG